MIRVYVDMVADLFHVGHLNLIKAAHEIGDYIIVGVHSDEDVQTYKRVPIIKQEQRYELIKSCKYVNEVVEAAPLIITEDFLIEHKIDFVLHGDDINEEISKQHRVPLSMNMMKYIPYTRGISTTSIIDKILRFYSVK
jgi:cytidyltransferase-like protein